MSSKNHLFKIVFHNQGLVYELYAREVGQSGIFGFIEISDLVFGATSSVVIDPSEDRLRTEFADVERIHVPMHSVIRIDEVEKTGTGRIIETESGSNVSPFPVPIYSPPGDRGN